MSGKSLRRNEIGSQAFSSRWTLCLVLHLWLGKTLFLPERIRTLETFGVMEVCTASLTPPSSFPAIRFHTALSNVSTDFVQSYSFHCGNIMRSV